MTSVLSCLVVLLGCVSVSLACSCVPSMPGEDPFVAEYCRANFVTHFKVEDMEEFPEEYRRLFHGKHLEVFKSDAPVVPDTLETATQGSLCGIELQKGEYLLMGYGANRLNLCSINTPWAPLDDALKEGLRNGKFDKLCEQPPPPMTQQEWTLYLEEEE